MDRAKHARPRLQSGKRLLRLGSILGLCYRSLKRRNLVSAGVMSAMSIEGCAACSAVMTVVNGVSFVDLFLTGLLYHCVAFERQSFSHRIFSSSGQWLTDGALKKSASKHNQFVFTNLI